MKAVRLIILIFAFVSLVLGLVWQSDETFRMKISEQYYVMPTNAIFYAVAVGAAFLFLLMTLKDLFRKK
ncbi:hypothetical protein SAMN05216480_11360 [Pustulibacterium marinum]|uniref:Uncharacterized protein n=1 Tax=Pustulibacterium marinum TaxID=1224947 RepID=A0A1I7I7F0_9FLAO|nr:hypothetical protein [Pustulibacterium marinum]SFU68696.1 hypothetical protein SAMN05216480_11360 [Pustulibacterium marinum]